MLARTIEVTATVNNAHGKPMPLLSSHCLAYQAAELRVDPAVALRVLAEPERVQIAARPAEGQAVFEPVVEHGLHVLRPLAISHGYIA